MKPRVVIIAGPTGIGKSQVAEVVAKTWNGEIINADASQIRRQLNIGTAKPDLSQTQVPHHLFDIIAADANFSIKDYQNCALPKIAEIISRNKLPVIVGGSGLYIASLVGDYPLVVPARDPLFSEQFAKLTNVQLHEQLRIRDENRAQALHPNNRRRVLRALEIIMNPVETQPINTKPFDALLICLFCERSLLYKRINARVEDMFNQGWINEVQDLINQGIDVSRLQEIGYADIKAYLDGLLTYEQVAEIIKQKTRHYAKRQITWFKHQLPCVFVAMDFDYPDTTIATINHLIDEFLLS
ncbi:MAG TPA: tRNA (adenosine(37)-N6)-dimethylallyltransferase MiaA [Bacilli bacterium]|nr:MAG: tRNA dimethylallyltransferase [Tenericutes bacterium ADurb.BinA124]HNZ50506.1 tRNA (adenosine(37)-N6)-dimethylallyltransferase MiaA [Bacilli bacterium]HPX84684.1 tRNA (adenosine(37)-N6)-dimethylallyltransferase MiaA [Bacilli bacterium]HQC74571.1 tRNA (adenosine(37)-N6)-dimethylallyltransferase MiaA [Bacilli bacterium]